MSRDGAGGDLPASAGRSDDELARLASEGSQDATRELLAKHGDDLYRFCVALAGEPSGKQLFERTLERAASEIRSGTRGLPVAPWLFTLAYEVAQASGPPAPGPHSQGLRGRFEGLSRTESAALVLREAPGLAYGMIGEVLHISSEQARDLIGDARATVLGAFARPTPECEIVQAALLRDDLPPLGRQAVERHIEGCRYCARARRGVATLPGLLERVLPKLAPLALFAMVDSALASVGGQGAPKDDGRDAARDAYRRRRSIAASAVLVLLVVVSALAVSTGRLNPDTGPGPSLGRPFVLPAAFFHFSPGDVKPAAPKRKPRPFVCGTTSCPPPLPGPVPVPAPRRCTGPNCPPTGCVGPNCPPRRHRCPDGTVEPRCKRPPRTCPPGTIEPRCKRPPRVCPPGTIEPNCGPVPPRCPDGTVEPDCHVPHPPCPDGTVEPDCHIPVPPPPPPCSGPHCGHDFEPLPNLCDHHHHHDHSHQEQQRPPTPEPASSTPDPVPVEPGSSHTNEPHHAPHHVRQPPATDSPAAQPASQPQPEPPKPQPEPEPEPQPQQPQPEPHQEQQPQQDHGQHGPPGRHHHDGGVQAQWAVESRTRNRSRRFSVL